jgi:hypothetical protein
MKQILVGVFQRHADASAAADALRAGGIAADRVRITSDPAALPAGRHPEYEDGVLGHVRSFFAELFGPGDHPVDVYADTVRGGGALVTVIARNADELDVARRTLQRVGAATIDERVDAPPP